MSVVEDIRSEIGGILAENFTTREGARVPEPAEVQLGNDAVKLNGTVL